MEEELQRIEEEKEATQVKIKRSDKEAFTRVRKREGEFLILGLKELDEPSNKQSNI